VKTTRPFRLLLLVNLAAALIIAGTLVVRRPIILFWGCYPITASIYDLDEGACYGFYGGPDAPLSPACDKPGNICGEEEDRWKALYAFEIHVAVNILTISFVIYFLFGFERRVEYFEIVAATKNT